MFRAKLVGLFALLIILSTLPAALADPNYSSHPWGISLQPIVFYEDPEGVLLLVEYNYHEEAGHFSNGILKPVLPWSYFLFYVNQTGVYYVDFMAFSGWEFPPFAFYNGWLYVFLLTSTNTSFPMKEPPVSDTVTVIRYRDGVIQKLGEVPWPVTSGLNVSLPYFLVSGWPKGKRTLYKIEDNSIKLVARGENLTLKNHIAWYPTLFKNFTMIYKECLIPKVEGNYVQFLPSHYKLPLNELRRRFEPVNKSCAVFFNNGLLIIPPSIGVGFANGSMWVQRGGEYSFGDVIALAPFEKGVPPKPLNLSLYLYEDGKLGEIPLFRISEEGVQVLAPRVKYETVLSTIPTTVLEIRADWGYHGFLLEITPTATSLIRVITGNITPYSHFVGQCSPVEDEATFHEYTYYINKSGSFLVTSPLFISSPHDSRTPSSSTLRQIETPTKPVYGRISGHFLVFSRDGRTYRIPLSNITPYLWDSSMSKHMAGYFLHGGVVFFPEIKVSVFELPSGYKIYDYIKHGEGITIKINGTYSLVLYKKDLGRSCWMKFKTIQLSEHDIESLLKKPVYVFFYDGRKLKVFPIMRVRMELNVGKNHHKVEIHTIYVFQNMAEKLKLRNNRTSKSKLSNTPSSPRSGNNATCGVGGIAVFSLLPLALKRRN